MVRWEREPGGSYRLGVTGWWVYRRNGRWVIRYWERRQGETRLLREAKALAEGWYVYPGTRPCR